MDPAKRELHNEKVQIKYNQKIHADPSFYAKEKRELLNTKMKGIILIECIKRKFKNTIK